ncbi:hypothetical protein LCGC14_1968000, partial [marine sediment metagenome]
IITPPVLTPTVTPVGKLPQELQDLVARYQAAASRSSKWTYQNKLKQLGYNVKTGVYTPTKAPVPVPKPKPKISEGVLPKSHFGKYEDWDKRLVTHKESLKQRMGFDLDVLKVGRTDTPEYKAALAKFEKALKSYTDPTMKLDYARKEFYTAGVKKFDNGFNKYCDILEDIAGNSALNHYNKKNIDAWVHKGKYRANAHPEKFTVDFGSADGLRAQFHEYGHLLENSKVIRRKSNYWVSSRGGHKRMRFDTINTWSADSQMAYKNKFIDSYVGKVYASGDTEVMSMGMMQFTSYKKMLRFAKKDFDHFSFVHGILTGAI